LRKRHEGGREPGGEAAPHRAEQHGRAVIKPPAAGAGRTPGA
jgi:hypothetical protein